jgi:hypothetical protein
MMRLWYKFGKSDVYKFINITEKHIEKTLDLKNPESIESDVNLYVLNIGLKYYYDKYVKFSVEKITKTKRKEGIYFIVAGNGNDLITVHDAPGVPEDSIKRAEERFTKKYIKEFFERAFLFPERKEQAIQEEGNKKEKQKAHKIECFYLFSKIANGKHCGFCGRKVKLEIAYMYKKNGCSYFYSPNTVVPKTSRKKNVMHFYSSLMADNKRYVVDIPIGDEYLDAEDWKRNMNLKERAKEEDYTLSSNSIETFKKAIAEAVIVE